MSTLFSGTLNERQPLACRIFENAINQLRLSHAYLLTGRAAEDKFLLAKLIACRLNCKQTAGANACPTACDNPPESWCRDCSWIWAESHPQAWLVLSGEESKSGKIAVEKARALCLELSKSSSCNRIVVIPNATADILHPPAANALLKTIEEAPGNSLFLLMAPDSASVLPTIVSRCQVVPIVQVDSSSVFRLPEQQQTNRPLLESQLSPHELSNHRAQYPHMPVGESMRWAAQADAANSQDLDARMILDWVIYSQFKQLKEQAACNPAVSYYLDCLIVLAQTTKDRLNSYVQPKAALEAFALGVSTMLFF